MGLGLKRPLAQLFFHSPATHTLHPSFASPDATTAWTRCSSISAVTRPQHEPATRYQSNMQVLCKHTCNEVFINKRQPRYSNLFFFFYCYKQLRESVNPHPQRKAARRTLALQLQLSTTAATGLVLIAAHALVNKHGISHSNLNQVLITLPLCPQNQRWVSECMNQGCAH